MHLAVPKYAARRLHPAGRTRPGPALVLVQFIYVLAVQNILQVLAVLVFLVYLIGGQNLFAADPAVQIGDLLQAGIFLCWWVSTVFTKFVASTRDSWVPVSSQVKP